MHFVLVSLAALACGLAVPVHRASRRLSKTLAEDLSELVTLVVPTDEILTVVFDYMSVDEEVQEITQFILSEEFKLMVLTLDSEPSYVLFIDYLHDKVSPYIVCLNYLKGRGLPVKYLLDVLHDDLGIPSRSSRQGTRTGVRDIYVAVPLRRLHSWYCEKMAKSGDWSNLHNGLKGEKFHALFDAFRTSDSWQTVQSNTSDYDVSTEVDDKIEQKIFDWDGNYVDFGINYHP